MKLIKVHFARQMVEAYEADRKVFAFRCVTGCRRPAQGGRFEILSKAHPFRRRHARTHMDYAMVFSRDGRSLHQYDGIVPLWLARRLRRMLGEFLGSSGCVRLSRADARALYCWASIGTVVQTL